MNWRWASLCISSMCPALVFTVVATDFKPELISQLPYWFWWLQIMGFAFVWTGGLYTFRIIQNRQRPPSRFWISLGCGLYVAFLLAMSRFSIHALDPVHHWNSEVKYYLMVGLFIAIAHFLFQGRWQNPAKNMDNIRDQRF